MDLTADQEIGLDADDIEDLLGVLTAHAQVQRVMRDHEAAARTEDLRGRISQQLRRRPTA